MNAFNYSRPYVHIKKVLVYMSYRSYYFYRSYNFDRNFIEVKLPQLLPSKVSSTKRVTKLQLRQNKSSKLSEILKNRLNCSSYILFVVPRFWMMTIELYKTFACLDYICLFYNHFYNHISTFIDHQQ